MEILQSVTRLALDVLYPPTCVACGADGDWLCAPCERRISLYRTSRPALEPLQQALAVGPYADRRLQALLRALKYRSATCLVAALENIVRRWRSEYTERWPWAGLDQLTIIPAPPDPRRERERGIDHAAVIADVVRRLLCPWAELKPLLVRTDHRPPNARLEEDRYRQANVLGLFQLKELVGGPILVVDDILTSGATAQAMGSVLQQAGAGPLFFLSIASSAPSSENTGPRGR